MPNLHVRASKVSVFCKARARGHDMHEEQGVHDDASYSPSKPLLTRPSVQRPSYIGSCKTGVDGVARAVRKKRFNGRNRNTPQQATRISSRLQRLNRGACLRSRDRCVRLDRITERIDSPQASRYGAYDRSSLFKNRMLQRGASLYLSVRSRCLRRAPGEPHVLAPAKARDLPSRRRPPPLPPLSAWREWKPRAFPKVTRDRGRLGRATCFLCSG